MGRGKGGGGRGEGKGGGGLDDFGCVTTRSTRSLP